MELSDELMSQLLKYQLPKEVSDKVIADIHNIFEENNIPFYKKEGETINNSPEYWLIPRCIFQSIYTKLEQEFLFGEYSTSRTTKQLRELSLKE